jgi:hypothetical protein
MYYSDRRSIARVWTGFVWLRTRRGVTRDMIFLFMWGIFGYVKDYQLLSMEIATATIVSHFLPHIFDLFCIIS